MYKVSRASVYLLILLGVIINLTLMRHIRMYGPSPDILVMLVVFYGLFLGQGRGLEAGIFAGVLQDIFALDFFGVNTFILALIGFLAGCVNAKIYRESLPTQILAVSGFNVIAMLSHYFIVSFLSGSIALNISEHFITSIIPSTIYTALLSIPVFAKLIRVYNLGQREDFL